MDRKDLKEIITAVIEKMKKSTPAPACGLFYGDDLGQGPTTIYGVGEEDGMIDTRNNKTK